MKVIIEARASPPCIEAPLCIEALSVEVRVGGRTTKILRDVDLTVAPGTICGLIGESGSGKTTLARAVLGILPHNFAVAAGSISVAGQSVAGAGTPVAYVPQDPSTALDPLFTIGAQINDLLRARRPDLRTREVRRACAFELLEAVHLPESRQILARRPHEVSGGQRQRLMIALALMTKPALIVADEPTTALDLTIQAQILRLIRQLADAHHLAVLLTTHDPGVAHEVCDMVAVMHRGRIVEVAPTDRLLRAPEHPYTRQLLAARAGGTP
jgi:peptide/nickel transport system ATP-binding protein